MPKSTDTRSPLADRITRRLYDPKSDADCKPLWQLIDEEAAAMPTHRVSIGAEMGRVKRVSFHYHRAASRAAGRNVLSVHWQGKCHLVHHLLCAVKIETHHQKRQPHCILRGFARQVDVFKGVGDRWRGGMVARIT